MVLWAWATAKCFGLRCRTRLRPSPNRSRPDPPRLASLLNPSSASPETTEDLFETRDSPRGRSIVAGAVQWAERMMQKVDNVTVVPESIKRSKKITGTSQTFLKVSLDTAQR